MKYTFPYSLGFPSEITAYSGCENNGFTRPYVPRKMLQDSNYICGSVTLRMLWSRDQLHNLLIGWFSHIRFCTSRKWICQSCHRTWCWELLWKNLSPRNWNVNASRIQISQQQWMITISFVMHACSTKQSVVKIFKTIFREKLLPLESFSPMLL